MNKESGAFAFGEGSNAIEVKEQFKYLEVFYLR